LRSQNGQSDWVVIPVVGTSTLYVSSVDWAETACAG
jgi:hypothetical protein